MYKILSAYGLFDYIFIDFHLYVLLLFHYFFLAVHHRATGCPNEFPRKLVRTTVSNDHAPEEGPLEGASLSNPSAVWDLSADRVNAAISPVHEDL